MVDETVDSVLAHYDVVAGRVFVLENRDDAWEVFLTYNVEDNADSYLPETISVHRKHRTNTIYTINALNVLVAELNGGRPSPDFVVDWARYPNRILLVSSDGGLRQIHTSVRDIVRA